MRASWRGGALALALIGCGGLAFAAQVGQRAYEVARFDPTAATIGEETTGSLGPLGVGPSNLAPMLGAPMTQALPLSDEERAHIHARVIRMPDAPTIDVPAPDLLTALPPFVPLMDLPAGAVDDVPLARGYKFVKLDDRILLVSPSTRIVVSEIPRYKLVQ
jgi:hypothetical protein